MRARVDGPRRHYSLDPAALAEIEAWLAPFREIWADRLDQLEDHLNGLTDPPHGIPDPTTPQEGT